MSKATEDRLVATLLEGLVSDAKELAEAIPRLEQSTERYNLIRKLDQACLTIHRTKCWALTMD